MPTISMIAALGAKTRVIGRDNDLPWTREDGLPPDLARFSRLTRDKPVGMGSNTWRSLPERLRPLPKRPNYVLSTGAAEEFSGAVVCRSFDELIDRMLATDAEEIMLIGGLSIYEPGIEIADRLYITEVGEDPPGDTFFPHYHMFRKVIEDTIEPNFDPQLRYLTLER